jgi:hypothetical protein
MYRSGCRQGSRCSLDVEERLKVKLARLGHVSSAGNRHLATGGAYVNRWSIRVPECGCEAGAVGS